MNRVKYTLEIMLVPVLFVVALIINIKDAVYSSYWEVKDAVRTTKFKYGIK